MHSAKTEGSKKGTVIEMSEQKKVTNVGKQKQMGMIITILVLVLLVVVVVIAMILGGGSSGNPSVTTNDVTPPSVTGNGNGGVTVPVNTNGGDVVADATGKISLKKTDVFSGPLSVIAAEKPFGGEITFLPTQDMSDTDIEAAGFARPKKYGLSASGYAVTLRDKAAKALGTMVDDFVTATGVSKSSFVVITGYATTNTASKYITGYTAYLKINDGGYYDFNYSGKKVTIEETEMTWEAWFKANCAKYGFVYTGVGEFSYVGLAHSKYMTDYNLDVATYVLNVVAAGKNGINVKDAEGASWTVRYVTAANGDTTTVTVGANAVCAVSGDNEKGFIVAVKGQ